MRYKYISKQELCVVSDSVSSDSELVRHCLTNSKKALI